MDVMYSPQIAIKEVYGISCNINNDSLSTNKKKIEIRPSQLQRLLKEITQNRQIEI